MRTRRLVLSKETLSEMTTDEMVSVKGAMPVITPVRGCVENLASQVVNCVTLFDPCTTR